jgi:S-methylmethionine-dependent homocysteine/selenocysteine methylase
MIVLDGAMGTELARRGVAQPLPGWSAHALEGAPDAVAAVHRGYAAAGAMVHTTNTFRTKRRSIGPAWEALARRAVRIARASAGGGRIAGSIAPLEDCYRPDSSPGLASRAEHAELARVLADEGVDLLLCETFPSRVEARVAVEEAVRTGLPTWVALHPVGAPGKAPGADDVDAALRFPLREAARECVDAGASAVLVNCVEATRTILFVEKLADLGVPFGAYANAGAPADGIGWGAEPDAGAIAYAALARSWMDVGATIVGGCCGTGPAHITRLARMLGS